MKTLYKEISESIKDTINLGRKIIKELPKEVNLIILKGELGAGKTTLVKGMAKELKINDEITSPTYGYKRSYDGLSHYDLFLTKKMKSRDLQSLISEDLENNIVIIEWGEKLPKLKNSIIIEIKYISEEGRVIEVKQV